MNSKRPRYFERYSDSPKSRLDEIVDMQRGVLRKNIHLIASACYPFPSVLNALSSPSFVFPAEGMPRERYLPGAQVMDLVEIEGESLTLKLFNSPKGYRATLQPHSGTQANQIAYNAILEPEDKVLCLRPRNGGHISHTVLISRRHESVSYGLTSEGIIDYREMRELALRYRPKLIIVGGSALPRQIDFGICADIARQSGAYLHADISHTATFIAAGVHSSVFPHCDFITFNTVKNLRGPNAGILIYRDELASKVHPSIFPVTQGGANETNMLGKFAALLEWQKSDIEIYAKSIIQASKLISKILINRGLTVVTGGTDCHIVLVELPRGIYTGADYETLFEGFGVLINKNLIPGDTRGPSETSGLRIGTTNLAILEYSIDDLTQLANWIADVIFSESGDDELIKLLTKKYNSNLSKWLN